MSLSPIRSDAGDPAPTRAISARAARREALLDKASEVFLEHGYQGATIDRIIAHAGGSKATIYKNFGDKQGLFLAIMERLGRDLFEGMDAVDWRGREAESVLQEIGEAYLKRVASPRAIGIWRLCVAEAGRSPDLARSAFERGPGAAVSRLTGVFEQLKAQGLLKVRDPHDAARAFLALLRRDDVFLGPLMGIAFKRSPGWRRRLAQESAAFFMNGVGGPR